MSQIIVFWLKQEIRMPRNVVFRLSHKIKMPQNLKIVKKTCEVKIPKLHALKIFCLKIRITHLIRW